MTLYMTRPVGEQPTLTMSNWNVVELEDGSRHLVGFIEENRDGRVSSPVASLDTASLEVRTRTGRRYILHGPPGEHLDANYVWTHWARIYDLKTWTSVTDEIWEVHMGHRHAHCIGPSWIPGVALQSPPL